MPDYTLELEAELDLLEIGRYTVRTWSIEQAERYLAALNQHFEAISRNDAIEKSVFEHRDDSRISSWRSTALVGVIAFLTSTRPVLG